MRRFIPLLWSAALLFVTAPASAEEAAALCDRAMERFAAADFEGSLALLERCRDGASEPGLRARAWLYIGVNQAVMRREGPARRSFRAALGEDPAVDLDPDQFKPALVSLFRQERRLCLGRLSVSATSPGAEVWLGDAPAGQAPLVRYLRPGKIRVRVRAGSGGPWTHDEVVQVEAGQTLRLALRGMSAQPVGGASADREPSGRVATWVVGGVGLAALAAGAVLVGLAAADHDEWEQVTRESRDHARWVELKDAGQSKQLAGNVLLGVGGAAAAAAVALFFLEPGWSAPDKEAGVRLSPLVGRALGASLGGTF